jgi:uncharacterized membrane protein YqjE
MVHPMFRLAAAQPMLLIGHVGAYATLLSQELRISGVDLQRRLLWQLAAALCLTVAAVLAGVALLLWAALPPVDVQVAWVFVITPWLPAVAGLWAWRRAQAPSTTEPFAHLRAQLAEDAALLDRHAGS